MQTNKPGLDDLELRSFVTSIPAEEQLAIKGAGLCWSLISWVGGNLLWEGTKAVIESQVNSNYPTTTTTSAGFFDTSYPCG